MKQSEKLLILFYHTTEGGVAYEFQIGRELQSSKGNCGNWL